MGTESPTKSSLRISKSHWPLRRSTRSCVSMPMIHAPNAAPGLILLVIWLRECAASPSKATAMAAQARNPVSFLAISRQSDDPAGLVGDA